MLTSKELIRRTGISRATLNNYIAVGILPKPLVRRSGPENGRAPRIGYFPKAAVRRVQEVQRLKQEGYSMAHIAERFRSQQLEGRAEAKTAVSAPAPTPGFQAEAAMAAEPAPSGDLRVTVADIPGPAYMVNNSFEVVWWNDHAAQQIFGLSGGLRGEIEARNVFRLLLQADNLRQAGTWQDILAFHLALAKKRLPREGLVKIYSSVGSRNAQLLEHLYDETEPVDKRPLFHRHVDLGVTSGTVVPCDLYASHFREGILFVYVPSEVDSDSLLELLSRREQVIRDLLKKRMPFLTNVGVLVADLQNSVQICAELPPEEYFALINHIWQAAEPVFRKYYGTHGKHVGDGMVYYFFPQPDCNYVLNAIHCAHDLKEVMREVSREWQARKNWLNELLLNSGLNEGQEWFGTYHTATNIEFTVLGDTINHAGRLSDFARFGSIWATKSMLGTLTPEERQLVRFGIRRQTERGDEVFVSDLYARISSMVDLNDGKFVKFRDIANLAVTEIVDATEDPASRQALPQAAPALRGGHAPAPAFGPHWRH